MYFLICFPVEGYFRESILHKSTWLAHRTIIWSRGDELARERVPPDCDQRLFSPAFSLPHPSRNLPVGRTLQGRRYSPSRSLEPCSRRRYAPPAGRYATKARHSVWACRQLTNVIGAHSSRRAPFGIRRVDFFNRNFYCRIVL